MPRLIFAHLVTGIVLREIDLVQGVPKKFRIEFLEVWQLCTLSGHFRHFWTVWTLFNIFGHSGQFWALLGTLGTFGHFGHYLALWSLFDIFGQPGHFWAL